MGQAWDHRGTQNRGSFEGSSAEGEEQLDHQRDQAGSGEWLISRKDMPCDDIKMLGNCCSPAFPYDSGRLWQSSTLAEVQ